MGMLLWDTCLRQGSNETAGCPANRTAHQSAHSRRGQPTSRDHGAEARYGISTGLIVTLLRHLSGEAAMQAYEQAIETGVPLLGIGLCSTELGNPAGRFAEVFARARSDGLHTVAHAGEEGDPSYVWDALDILGVERVDHGIRSIEDPLLLRRLIREQIPLTVCPLSNVRLKAVGSLGDHPLAALLRLGARVSVNSDDPAYFGGYLDDNVAAVREAFGLSDAEVAQLARNSILSSFATDEEKARLLASS